MAVRNVAETIGRGLSVSVASLTPEEARGHFGWLAPFVAFDHPSSSAQTRARLGWIPTGPSLLTDLANRDYPGTERRSSCRASWIVHGTKATADEVSALKTR